MFQLSLGGNRTSLSQIAEKCHQFKDSLLFFGSWTIPEFVILAFCLYNFEVCMGWNDAYLKHFDTEWSEHAWSGPKHPGVCLIMPGVAPACLEWASKCLKWAFECLELAPEWLKWALKCLKLVSECQEILEYLDRASEYKDWASKCQN